MTLIENRARALTIDEVGDMWHLGGEDKCEQLYKDCDLDRLDECFAIL